HRLSTRLSSPAHASPDIYTLSLHDALPIWIGVENASAQTRGECRRHQWSQPLHRNENLTYRRFYRVYRPPLYHHLFRSLLFSRGDRKSTRLNSSHVKISYAVFCLKKKNKQK